VESEAMILIVSVESAPS